ncbi:MAG: phosphate ABC transporter permease subunit PstC [Gammaproteobacteria bacterium]|jgi:phosphate transport system permease protein|nr:phosphate ABC transporter permease subunit PstC [Gammaproteobacteria bacterium]MBT7523612.1 phosphate ABC transporter permease subunit PstC [Gammaproteobacteria bacterium]MBT7814192.1 phosphate ABC transporter permease subunit PstC [Gammaproteobacteria bacterium]
MNITIILIIIGLLGISAYYTGLRKSLTLREDKLLHSTPIYHGAILAINSSLASILLVIVWVLFEKNIFPELLAFRNILFIISIFIFFLTAFFTFKKIKNKFKARDKVEKIIELFLLVCSSLAILITVGIFLSVIFESNRFFESIPLTEFLFGTHWSPQMPIREDQAGSTGAFGAVPLFTGTFLIAFIAMCIAGPIGLMSAIFLSEYASKSVRDIVKPLTEILAGIPTVVYGFFAVIVVAPFIRNTGNYFGIEVASESALAAGLVMGVMIIPFVSSISDDVINAVPQNLKNGSLGVGATKSETIKLVIIPAALPGIIGGLLLAVSRAIGETMIVVMAAGMSANLTANPFEAVTTVTVQIVVLLVGDQEFDSPKTLAAFALGLVLFIMTLILNYIALHIVRKYREQYE